MSIFLSGQGMANEIRTISYYVPMVLIPLSLALCISLGSLWQGPARLPHTLMWLADITLGYAAIQLVLLLVLSNTYNRPEYMLPSLTDIYIYGSISAINYAVGVVLYAMQLVTLALSFFSVLSQRKRNRLWILATLLGLLVVPFAHIFPGVQLTLNPTQATSATWRVMLITALLADAAIVAMLVYARYAQRAALLSDDNTDHVAV
jgi:hypothetical protein